MSLFSKKQTGDRGENYCAKYLKKQGYRILCRNYRKPCGEIDIIAEKTARSALSRSKRAITARSPDPMRRWISASSSD